MGGCQHHQVYVEAILRFLCALLSYAVVISWVLCDGLEPGAIGSHGVVALQQFLEGFAPMLIVSSYPKLIALPKCFPVERSLH
jgi:hypothetical protein